MNNFELEIELKDYLNKHIEIVKKALKDGFLYHEIAIVDSVEIDDDYFSMRVQTMKGSPSCAISPYYPIPEKFLRKYKLKKIYDGTKNLS